jgi:hypothetical protein
VTRDALDARVLDWMRDPHWKRDDARFESLARDLFAHQLAHCEPYRRFCARRGVDATSLRSWREIPAVPTGAFKEVALRGFPAERTVKVFRTSGTATDRRGALHLDTLVLYEASLLPSFRRGVLPDLARGARARLRILAPSPAEVPDSSLSHMFGCALAAFGDAGSGFDVQGGELRVETLWAALERAIAERAAVVLCGTAFAFVHLLDALQARAARLALPAGSRVLETGGFKGRSREMPQAELYAAIERALGVPAARIVNQYGMCELGSQFYDSVLREPAAPRRKLAPPWTRVRLVDPTTGADAAGGEVGVVHVYDLANTGSVLAIQTADLGRAIGDGFEILGREPGAEARGCSIAADAMLAP